MPAEYRVSAEAQHVFVCFRVVLGAVCADQFQAGFRQLIFIVAFAQKLSEVADERDIGDAQLCA